jgi:hypothetical protein
MMLVNCDFIYRYIALKMLENIHADLGRSALPSRTISIIDIARFPRMIYSGLRYGAVDILKIGDLQKIKKYNLYKITAYRNSKKFKYNTG